MRMKLDVMRPCVMSQRNLTNMNYGRWNFPFHVFCRWTHVSYHSVLCCNDGLMNLVSRKHKLEQLPY